MKDIVEAAQVDGNVLHRLKFTNLERIKDSLNGLYG